MANRIITAAVTGETIKLSDKNAGAAGSFNAVSLALTFDSAWDGTTKKVYFFDSFYANPVYILLTVDYYNSETGVYTVPIPAEPLAYAGNMTITIKGVDFATDGTTAERIIMSASTEMKVASAIIPSTDTAPAEPTPTQAEQLLASVNSVTGMTVTSETLASGSSATVTKSENVDGTINLGFGLPTGNKGDKGDTGDTGATGATGNGISSVTLNPDYTLTINFTDSTSTTTTSIRGATGAKGDTGDTGATGNGIASIVLVSGTHAAGTTDTYRITFTDSTTFDFTVYNGADGEGAGDMLASVYDPIGKNADAFSLANMTEDATHRLVTDTEKSTWNGKQDALGFTPATSTHTHGNITTDGKIGSTADLPVFTTTDGAVTTKTIAEAKALFEISSGGSITSTVNIASGQTLTAYDVVDIINGEAQKTLLNTFGTPQVFESASISYTSAVALSDSKILIAYQDVGNSNYGTAIVGTISGTTITFGTAQVFESAATLYISAVALSDSKILIAYRDVGNSDYGTAIVGTISGTTITFGTAQVFESASISYTSAVALSDSKILIAYRDNGNSNYGTSTVGYIDYNSSTEAIVMSVGSTTCDVIFSGIVEDANIVANTTIQGNSSSSVYGYAPIAGKLAVQGYWERG